jgi:hypothetical protein
MAAELLPFLLPLDMYAKIAVPTRQQRHELDVQVLIGQALHFLLAGCI